MEPVTSAPVHVPSRHFSPRAQCSPGLRKCWRPGSLIFLPYFRIAGSPEMERYDFSWREAGCITMVPTDFRGTSVGRKLTNSSVPSPLVLGPLVRQHVPTSFVMHWILSSSPIELMYIIFDYSHVLRVPAHCVLSRARYFTCGETVTKALCYRLGFHFAWDQKTVHFGSGFGCCSQPLFCCRRYQGRRF